jgi:hypothetical protein
MSGCMIRLHAHPLPPSPDSKLPLFLSLPVPRRSTLLTERGGGVWSRFIRPQENLALYKSFNTLCSHPSISTPTLHLPSAIVHTSSNTDNFTRF